jgi:hypothetical protein
MMLSTALFFIFLGGQVTVMITDFLQGVICNLVFAALTLYLLWKFPWSDLSTTLLSVADGHSKWAYSYQINADGALAHKERFFHLHVNDWDDDAGAESVCYSLEGRQYVATKSGVQISADDGPTQVILAVPGNGRVTGVAMGGKEMDTLFAFCGNKIWKRKPQVLQQLN